MRNTIYLSLAAALLLFTRTSFAACTAPEGQTQTPCISCGNLEQNVARAHDLAWNEFLRNATMQIELRVYGTTLVHLVNPPHSSPGVLYYTVIIEDPQFNVADVETHAEALQLMQSWRAGVTYDPSGFEAEWVYRRAITRRVEDIVSRSVSTGSAPYIMRLMDSRGNIVPGGSALQPRLAGVQMLTLAGPRDLFPDGRYANEACASADPRDHGDSPTDSGTNGGGDSSGGGPDDSSDYWEGAGNGYGEQRPLCRPDFSDPAGAGVICVV